MALCEQGWAANVEQNEAGLAAGKRTGNVGAVGFELQRRLEVGVGGCAFGGGDGGDGVVHIGSEFG
jgi:hypothetical protein